MKNITFLFNGLDHFYVNADKNYKKAAHYIIKMTITLYRYIFNKKIMFRFSKMKILHFFY